MAKQDDVKKAIGAIVSGTPSQAQEPEPEKEDRVKARGIGLKTSEWDRIDEIAKEMGIKPHAVALWAMKDFLKRYDAGEIKTVTQKTLPGL